MTHYDVKSSRDSAVAPEIRFPILTIFENYTVTLTFPLLLIDLGLNIHVLPNTAVLTSQSGISYVPPPGDTDQYVSGIFVPLPM